MYYKGIVRAVLMQTYIVDIVVIITFFLPISISEKQHAVVKI